MVWKLARPYTEAESVILKRDFLAEYEKTDGAVYITCRKVGIPNQTYQYWKEHDKEFAQQIHDLNCILDDRRENIYKDECFNKRNMVGMIHYLKKKMKHRGYGDDQQIVNNFLTYTPGQDDKDAFTRFKELTNKSEDVQSSN